MDKEKDLIGTSLSSWEIVSGLGVSEVGEQLTCADLRENLPPEKLPLKNVFYPPGGSDPHWADNAVPGCDNQSFFSI